jgi:hypothetical protein
MGAEYTLKLSGAGAKELTSALWSVASSKQKTKGKMRLASLLKSGSELKVFNVTQGELKEFAKQAKRYGAIYAVIKTAKDDPSSRVDIMVKAEDAAKINRIVEHLEYSRYDATELVVEAKRELSHKFADSPTKLPSAKTDTPNTDKGEAQEQPDGLLGKLLNKAPQKEGATPQNPMDPLAKNPPQSETSSKTGGQDNKTIAEDATQNSPVKSKTSKTREGCSFDDNKKRQSVKAQIEKKRSERKGQSRSTPTKTKANQTRHQNYMAKKRKIRKEKLEKGR